MAVTYNPKEHTNYYVNLFKLINFHDFESGTLRTYKRGMQQEATVYYSYYGILF